MNTGSLHDYIKDLCATLGDKVKFFSGRFEVITETMPPAERNTQAIEDRPIYAYLLPIVTSGEFDERSLAPDETRTVQIIFFKQDRVGSQINKNKEDEKSDEIKILESVELVVSKFVRQFNFNQINLALSEASDKVNISSYNTEVSIKNTSLQLTGITLEMEVSCSDSFDYCSLPQNLPLTNLEVEDNVQYVTGNISEITITLDAPGSVIAKIPAGLTLTKNSDTEWVINGAVTQDETFAILAIGTFGNCLAESVSISYNQIGVFDVLELTQAEYDALPVPLNDTIYLIEEE